MFEHLSKEKLEEIFKSFRETIDVNTPENMRAKEEWVHCLWCIFKNCLVI